MNPASLTLDRASPGIWRKLPAPLKHSASDGGLRAAAALKLLKRESRRVWMLVPVLEEASLSWAQASTMCTHAPVVVRVAMAVPAGKRFDDSRAAHSASLMLP